MMPASTIGKITIMGSANQAYWNGFQNHGSSLRPLHSIKSSGLPPVASSLRYMAIA
jgi:hypothetical protein